MPRFIGSPSLQAGLMDLRRWSVAGTYQGEDASAHGFLRAAMAPK